MDTITDKVARQYTEHAYPPAPDDVARFTDLRADDHSDPGAYAPLLWPEAPRIADLDILIAGCGTYQAAVMALNNPTCRVWGIDLSATSLQHEAFLRERHQLKNLELIQGDLRQVGDLGSDFDLVVSTGVLHHLPEPDEGLAALRSVMRPAAALSIMVYGATFRAGLYMLQDAFRRMGLGQGAADIAAVRQILEGLIGHHFARPYIEATPELHHDPAVVDTFLHPQDRAYTVPQLLEWVQRAGLEFQGWTQNQRYYPDATMNEPALGLIQRLPAREQWAVVENLLCVAGVHTFVCRLPGQARSPSFDGDLWRGFVPALRPDANLDDKGRLLAGRIEFEVTPAEAAAIRLADGRTTIGAIIDNPIFAPFSRADRDVFGRTAFERFWKIAAITLAMPE